MHNLARILIGTAGALMTAGGLYDAFAPRLPRNLASICGSQAEVSKLVRELLRALGGALVSVGAAVVCLAMAARSGFSSGQLALVVVLTLPAEGMNAFAMRKVGSPWQFPAIFVALALAGVLLALVP